MLEGRIILFDARVLKVKGNGVGGPDTLRGGRGIIKSIATPDDRFLGHAPGKPQAGRKIVLVGIDQAAANTCLLSCGYSIGYKEWMNLRLDSLSRHDKSSFVAIIAGAVRIEIDHQVVLVNEWCMHLIAQTEVERQSWTYLEIVLNEDAKLVIGNIESRTHITHIGDGSSGRYAEKELGETIEGGSIADGSTRIVSI